MAFIEAQELFTFIFAIHFTLIIDRVHRNYNAYDTYDAWNGKPYTIKRLLLSWLILYILPLLNFAAFFIILGIHDISFTGLDGVLNIILVALSSFFSFGYYRIFEGILYLSPNTFYTDIETEEVLVEERGEFQAHFIPGILYIVASSIIILIIVLMNIF